MIEFKECFGYDVSNDGKIFNKHNKELKQHLISKQIKININGKQKNISINKFVYYAFHKDFNLDDNSYMVINRDGNEDNLNINNLQLEYKGNVLQGENNVFSKLTDEQAEEIINKYHNGNKRYTYQQLAKEYGVSKSLVWKIVNKQIRNKEDYKMKNKKENV